MINTAKKIYKQAKNSSTTIILPTDLKITKSINNINDLYSSNINNIPINMMSVDI
jgi:3-phosphoglycerate kinase